LRKKEEAIFTFCGKYVFSFFAGLAKKFHQEIAKREKYGGAFAFWFRIPKFQCSKMA